MTTLGVRLACVGMILGWVTIWALWPRLRGKPAPLGLRVLWVINIAIELAIIVR